MTYDSFVTAAVAGEAQALVGAFVDHITQPAERDLYVTFYVPSSHAARSAGGKARWVFSADARLARVHQVEGKPENPATPPGFCMLLRKWIEGARLTGVRQIGFDRILRWDFSRGDGRRALVAEVMGKHSNLILLDEEDQILGAIKLVPAAVSRARQVLPGLPYVPPPGDRLNPLTSDPEVLAAALSARMVQGSEVRPQGSANNAPTVSLEPESREPPSTVTPEALIRAVAGFGPFAAAEAIARAGGSDPEAVAKAVCDLAAATREGRFEPTLIYEGKRQDAKGECRDLPEENQQHPRLLRGFWAFHSVQLEESAQVRAASMSAAADRFYSTTVRGANEQALRKELLTRVRKERERLERLAHRLEEDLRRGDAVEQWKIAGELLATNLWQVERGQTEVEVPNYYDPEQRPLRIELNPELTPQENVERLFRKYRKGTDAALQAIEQSQTVSTRLAEARKWEERVTHAAAEELSELSDPLRAAGLLQDRTGQGASSNPKSRIPNQKSDFPPGVRIRRYVVDGWEVLLGENATSNDFLTTRIARPDDWWLHVRAATSAHVVIRTGGQPQRVPPTVMEKAARITAAHSESKHSSYVPVDYVLKKYVRKPRGSAPGLVTLQGEKTLYVEPSSEAAAR